MIDSKKIIIATIKKWNIDKAREFKEIKGKDIRVITNKDDLMYEKIKEDNPKYIFFPHWSWKIPKEIYENWECIVFHMTDLPFGRGGSPLQNLIERGIYKTKISALRVVEEMDAGPIYMKKELDISNGSAEEILINASNIIFNDMIPFIIENEIKPELQKGEVTVFSRRTKEQSDISKLNDLNQLYDYIRMLDGEGYPPAFINSENLIYEFTKAKLVDNAIEAKVKISLKGRK